MRYIPNLSISECFAIGEAAKNRPPIQPRTLTDAEVAAIDAAWDEAHKPRPSVDAEWITGVGWHTPTPKEKRQRLRELRSLRSHH